MCLYYICQKRKHFWQKINKFYWWKTKFCSVVYFFHHIQYALWHFWCPIPFGQINWFSIIYLLSLVINIIDSILSENDNRDGIFRSNVSWIFANYINWTFNVLPLSIIVISRSYIAFDITRMCSHSFNHMPRRAH